jgi:hypothetical protein
VNTEHLITPPTELVRQWSIEAENEHQPTVAYSMVSLLAAKAAQWGSARELEACCMWITREKSVIMAEELGNVRRPKPPSLKEQALEALKDIECGYVIGVTTSTIRRALEALPND